MAQSTALRQIITGSNHFSSRIRFFLHRNSKTANIAVDRARRLHSTFDSINQVVKHATRAPVQRVVGRDLLYEIVASYIHRLRHALMRVHSNEQASRTIQAARETASAR